MKKQNKKIPKFKNEDEERDFWAKNDTLEYFDWTHAQKVVFPDLKQTTKAISIRLPESMIDELKVLANKRDVPYQSLIKIFLFDKIQEEEYRPSLASSKIRNKRLRKNSLVKSS